MHMSQTIEEIRELLLLILDKLDNLKSPIGSKVKMENSEDSEVGSLISKLIVSSRDITMFRSETMRERENTDIDFRTLTKGIHDIQKNLDFLRMYNKRIVRELQNFSKKEMRISSDF